MHTSVPVVPILERKSEQDSRALLDSQSGQLISLRSSDPVPKKLGGRAGEMAQQLRVLGALLEDQGLILRTYMAADICKICSRGSNALFWSLRASHTCGAQTYMKAEHPHT